MAWRMVHPFSSLIVYVPDEEVTPPTVADEPEPQEERSIEEHPGRMNRAFANLSKKARGVVTRGAGDREL